VSAGNVDEIARMLAIERGNQLSGVEIGEGYDLHLRKADFHDRGNAAQL
jgi:hypothetical protein